ncbi:MAG: hypothetical protein ACLQU3_10365 [Limisphaerales bacterium]
MARRLAHPHPARVDRTLVPVTGSRSSSWATHTGARLGDCARMKWNNVNFQDHMLAYEQNKTGKVGYRVAGIEMARRCHPPFEL